MRAVGCLMFTLVLTAQAVAQDRARTIHVFVALCDNQHQGIVPVPAKLGNGQDPANNLYWGALYGVKTFLKNPVEILGTRGHGESRRASPVLKGAVFKHVTSGVYLVADAYRGDKIKNAVEDFLSAAAGNNA